MGTALALLPQSVLADASPSDGLVTALTGQITSATTTVVAVFGAVIGLVFLFALGRFIIGRVRGSVK